MIKKKCCCDSVNFAWYIYLKSVCASNIEIQVLNWDTGSIKYIMECMI